MELEKKADPISRERAGFLAGQSLSINYELKKTVKGIYSHPIVYRCIDQISSSVASLDFNVEENGEIVENSQVADLLSMPSPQVDGSALIYHLIASQIAFGDGYLIAMTGVGGIKTEIWNIDSDNLSLQFNSDGTVAAYVYKKGAGNQERVFELNENGTSPEILRISRNSIKSGQYLGQSALEPASQHAKVYMANLKRMTDMLENSINDSGVLSISSKDDGELTEPQFKDIVNELKKFRTSGKRSGDLAVVQDVEFTFQKLSQDLESGSLEKQNDAARMICNVFGVPPMLLGIPGDNTYSNYQSARSAFWTDMLIPYYIKPLERSLSRWFGVKVTADLDSVPALIDMRTEMMKCYESISYLTINEKRNKAGLEPVDGGDVIYTNISSVPIGDIDTQNSIDGETDEELDSELRSFSVISSAG